MEPNVTQDKAPKRNLKNKKEHFRRDFSECDFKHDFAY